VRIRQESGRAGGETKRCGDRSLRSESLIVSWTVWRLTPSLGDPGLISVIPFGVEIARKVARRSIVSGSSVALGEKIDNGIERGVF
jgi:hypothetical protein